jgi:hypothetical protein
VSERGHEELKLPDERGESSFRGPTVPCDERYPHLHRSHAEPGVFPGSLIDVMSREDGMATEAGRHKLYEKAKERFGQEEADELMSLLPPVGWADVATKSDLDHLADRLRAEMRREMMTMQRWLVTTQIGVAGLLFAALRLTGTS